ncbi:hypothetical protein D1AOALGA4SA_10701 [Olavius algarvensis Delta 1 endosymbiont]|nr:hypothetical protein D1AOALGA4SA_10701 [Olavius algarvensis Delta 1 endosymbiont]
MEYWECKADDGLILHTDPCHPYMNRSVALNPAFQHSSIPSFRPRLQQVHGIAEGMSL